MRLRSDSEPTSARCDGSGDAWPRLRHNQRGATMVEFALIALPFFILLYGTFEIGFIYWATQELENATSHGARLVRTGQVLVSKMNQVDLRNAMCSQTAVLVGCGTKLRLDVRSASTFAGITPPSPLNGSGALKDEADFSFAPGSSDDVVLVSAFYNWKPLMKSSDYILRASSVTRNEPF